MQCRPVLEYQTGTKHNSVCVLGLLSSLLAHSLEHISPLPASSIPENTQPWSGLLQTRNYFQFSCVDMSHVGPSGLQTGQQSPKSCSLSQSLMELLDIDVFTAMEWMREWYPHPRHNLF